MFGAVISANSMESVIDTARYEGAVAVVRRVQICCVFRMTW